MERNYLKKIFMRLYWGGLLSFTMTGLLLANNSMAQVKLIENPEVSISMDNAYLSEVLSAIEKQTGLSFFYVNNLLQLRNKVNISAKNKKLKDVLMDIAGTSNLEFLQVGNNIAIKNAPMLMARDTSAIITGVVSDTTTHEALPGVSIVIKGTTTGVITDASGSFKIKVPGPSSILQFSYIGYEQREIAVGFQHQLNVALSDIVLLMNDVVVIGYGSTSKKDLTSSVTTIRQNDMNKGVYSSPAQLLQGKIAGLSVSQSGDPNATPTVILRGPSTLRTGEAQQPFYVIDGVPGASIDLVAPSDILSIDVLRDASATAIYGARAANGVIIVTTRRPQQGSVQVSLNSYMAVESVSNRIDMLSASELKKFLSDNNKSLSATDDDGSTTDWQNKVMRTGVSQNHNLSISGGTDKTQFSANANYFDNQGIMKGSSLERLNGRISLEQKALKDKLKIGLTLNNSNTKQNLIPSQVFTSMLIYLPTVGVRQSDGSRRFLYRKF
jgi:TonB-dependent starch-binding outer membrane protein SusC